MVRGDIIIFPLLVTLVSGQGTFKVFQNTLDLSDFGLISGAILNASGSGYVDALTVCMRFQVKCVGLYGPNKNLYIFIWK